MAKVKVFASDTHKDRHTDKTKLDAPEIHSEGIIKSYNSFYTLWSGFK